MKTNESCEINSKDSSFDSILCTDCESRFSYYMKDSYLKKGIRFSQYSKGNTKKNDT